MARRDRDRAGTRAGPARRRRRTERYRVLREYFGAPGVGKESRRYAQDIAWVYRGTLVERFLLRHLAGPRGRSLEIGPGPGRFTPLVARRSRSLVVLDLSRPMLRSCRRRLDRERIGTGVQFVEAAVESLPFRPGSFDTVVALGVLLFSAQEFSRVLAELARLLRPGGRLIFEMHTPSQDTMTILPEQPRAARRLLARPTEHYLWRVVRDGYQPYDPPRMAQFEVVWRRPDRLLRELRASGLGVVDRLAVAPNFGAQPRLLRALRRDRRAYATALELEEETGRWTELLGAGSALLVAARRTSGRRRARAARRTGRRDQTAPAASAGRS